MIGLDTNVVVRYLTQDDPDQAARANRLFAGLTEDNPGYVSHVVLAETYWVLRSGYQADRVEILQAVQGLLEAREISVEAPDVVRRAVRDAASGGGFADALIARSAESAGCSTTMTFDSKAAKLTGMTLLSG